MTTDMHISEKSTVVEDVFDGHLRAESPIIGMGQLSHPSDPNPREKWTKG